MANKKPSFEEALKRLETLTEEIEQGKVGLEESIAKYEEGMALVKQCRDLLGAAELRITQLQSSMQAGPVSAAGAIQGLADGIASDGGERP